MRPTRTRGLSGFAAMLLAALMIGGCVPNVPPEWLEAAAQMIQATRTAQAASASPTAEPATPTPIPPTATDTPAPPTDTPTATDTPAPPTDTPTATDTPALPTDTPTATPEAPATPVARAARISATIRTWPSASAPVLGRLRSRDSLPITGRTESSDWWQVCCVADQPGWVAASEVEVSGPTDAVPVVTVEPPATPTPTDTPEPTAAPTFTPTPTATDTPAPTATPTRRILRLTATPTATATEEVGGNLARVRLLESDLPGGFRAVEPAELDIAPGTEPVRGLPIASAFGWLNETDINLLYGFTVRLDTRRQQTAWNRLVGDPDAIAELVVYHIEADEALSTTEYDFTDAGEEATYIAIETQLEEGENAWADVVLFQRGGVGVFVVSAYLANEVPQFYVEDAAILLDERLIAALGGPIEPTTLPPSTITTTPTPRPATTTPIATPTPRSAADIDLSGVTLTSSDVPRGYEAIEVSTLGFAPGTVVQGMEIATAFAFLDRPATQLVIGFTMRIVSNLERREFNNMLDDPVGQVEDFLNGMNAMAITESEEVTYRGLGEEVSGAAGNGLFATGLLRAELIIFRRADVGVVVITVRPFSDEEGLPVADAAELLDERLSEALGIGLGPTLTGRVVFISSRSGNDDVYTMNADGSDVQQLTDDAAEDRAPRWSPDGTQIAFYADSAGRSDIYVIDADGSNLTQLTDDPGYDYGPAWSPDGIQIAFASDRGGNYDIYVMDADGSHVMQLTDETGDQFQPTWSPDGTQIAFVSDRRGNYDIYVMDADGNNLSRLTNTSGQESHPQWSPDGTRLVVHDDSEGDWNIYVITIADGEPRRLTADAAQDSRPTWSPDGRYILFDSDRSGSYDLYRMDADSSAVEPLTDTPDHEWGAHLWTP